MTTPGAIRRLRALERDRVRDHLLRLDGDDRLRRFGGYVNAAQVAAYCDRLDWSRGLILGYMTGAEAHAIGELKPLGASASRAAELAVSVERSFQNRGIGTALLRRLVIASRNRLIDRLHMVCLIDNVGAVRLARRLDGALSFGDGQAEARLEPPWPTLWTWLEEAVSEAALVHHPQPPHGSPRLTRSAASCDQLMAREGARPAWCDRGQPPPRSARTPTSSRWASRPAGSSYTR